MEGSTTPSPPLPVATSVENPVELPLPTSTLEGVTVDLSENSLEELPEQQSAITDYADHGPVGAVTALDEVYTEVHELMAQRLPKFVILQSNYNHNYLRLNNAIANLPNALQFYGDYSFSSDTRFELVPATTGGGLLHIRSMYNNKYLSREHSGSLWVTAGATEPEEDIYKLSSTLFRPLFVNAGDNTTVRFRHVNSGYYACLWRVAPPKNDCLYLGSSTIDRDQCDVFTIIDWQSVIVLPNRIVIKGNNNMYLRSWRDGFMYFNHQSLGNPELEYEVTPSRNGGVRLKSIFYDRYLRNDPHSIWVFADGRSPIHYTETVFIPVKLDNNVVAFRCLRDNLFCKRLTTIQQVNAVAAVSTIIDVYSRMAIEEPVRRREIENVNFRLNDAKISRENVLVLLSKEVENGTSETNTVVFDLKYTDTQTSTWNADVSITLGVATTISSGIPFVGEASIEYSAQFNSSYQWGESIEQKVETGSLFTVPVPPMSRVKASLMASKGSCDIPFSYTQRDHLLNGTIKVYQKDDGLYTGANSFNYRYQTEQLPL